MKNDEPSEKTEEQALTEHKARSERQIRSFSLEYAGFWRRFVAFFVDSLILGCFSAFFIGMFFANSPQVGSIITSIFAVGYILVFWTLGGQTPGKLVMKVTIVKTDGNDISIKTAILRLIGYIISTILILTGHLMIAFNGRKQGLHDKIAGTYVIKT